MLANVDPEGAVREVRLMGDIVRYAGTFGRPDHARRPISDLAVKGPPVRRLERHSHDRKLLRIDGIRQLPVDR